MTTVAGVLYVIKFYVNLQKLYLSIAQFRRCQFLKFFRHCGDLTETFLKPFKTLVSRVLSDIKLSDSRRVLYVIKHSTCVLNIT